MNELSIFSFDNSAGIRWIFEGLGERLKMTFTEQQVFTTIRASKAPIHSLDIAKMTGLYRTDVIQALHSLKRKGLIEKVGAAKLQGKVRRNAYTYRYKDLMDTADK